jgi:hypothetical protein
MRFISYYSILIFILALSLSIISAQVDTAVADDSLDGKSFSVEMTDTGTKEATKDELVFNDGTFMSTECEQYGFTPGAYESKSKGGAVLFESTLMSDKEGKAEWEGSVQGGNITGTMIWTKEGQDPVIYTYEGTLKE